MPKKPQTNPHGDAIKALLGETAQPAEQQVFKVNISKTVYYGKEVTVVATSAEEAAEIAEERAQTHDYGYGYFSTDYESQPEYASPIRPATEDDIKRDEKAAEDDDFADLTTEDTDEEDEG